MSAGRRTVLIVDDDPDVVELFASALGDDYDVVTAASGAEALDVLDSIETVDVVLLDRRMPGLSGDEVLGTIEERGLRCPVAMITAVEPDFDVVEMGFQDYLVKPVDIDDVRETVESLLVLAEQESLLREYVSLSVKDAALQRIKAADDLDRSDDYETLKSRVRAVSAELGDPVETLTDEEFDRLVNLLVRRA